jgi:hypothetical protein
LHTKYFNNQTNYKTRYKILVCAIRSDSAVPARLVYVIHRAIVQWLRNEGVGQVAEWFEKYWMDNRGNYMLAHSEIGSTNNNKWNRRQLGGLKKAVC